MLSNLLLTTSFVSFISISLNNVICVIFINHSFTSIQKVSYCIIGYVVFVLSILECCRFVETLLDCLVYRVQCTPSVTHQQIHCNTSPLTFSVHQLNTLSALTDNLKAS
jgi:hypothetical protein